MPARRKIPARLQEQVRQRANNLCEYCHASEKWQYVRFTVDHIVPLAQAGTNSFDNLALACFHCNRRKTDKVVAIDPDGEEAVPVFHPRHQVWSEHFIWATDGVTIVGLTATGRATIAALALNRERVMAIRAADHVAGRHPPPRDPIRSR